ncbi:hypothetical protein LINPERPRIM_LOCUS1476 [Linum perenne]
MATRYRALSKSTASLFRYTVNKPTGAKPIPTSTASFFPARPSSTLSRPVAQLGSLQSLLPRASALILAAQGRCLRVCSAMRTQEFDILPILFVLLSVSNFFYSLFSSMFVNAELKALQFDVRVYNEVIAID